MTLILLTSQKQSSQSANKYWCEQHHRTLSQSPANLQFAYRVQIFCYLRHKTTTRDTRATPATQVNQIFVHAVAFNHPHQHLYKGAVTHLAQACQTKQCKSSYMNAVFIRPLLLLQTPSADAFHTHCVSHRFELLDIALSCLSKGLKHFFSCKLAQNILLHCCQFIPLPVFPFPSTISEQFHFFGRIKKKTNLLEAAQILFFLNFNNSKLQMFINYQ